MWFLNFIPDSVLIYILSTMIGAGVLGYCASIFLRYIPAINLYAIPIKIASIVVFLLGIFFMGGYGVEMSWRAKVEDMKQEIAKKEEESKEATSKVIVKYVERIKVVKETSDVQIKAIPQLISKDADAKCDVPNGFVVLHDAAAKNEIPDTTSGTNAASSGIKISEVGQTVTENYGTCNTNSEQLKSLQEWIRAQQKIYN